MWPRRIIIFLALLALVGAWLAKDPAIQRYKVWKQNRSLKQARQFIQQQDAPKAQVALEVALAAVPGNPEAWRVAADMLEQVGAPQAMKLRRRLVQLAPDSADDRSALVMSALRFQDYNTAREALSDMTPTQASQPLALKAALAYALATDNSPVADALFERLKPLYPENEDIKVAHATLRLRHPRPERAAEAKKQLDEFAKNPKYSLSIHRELMTLAIQQRDMVAAKKWVDLIVADPAAKFPDLLEQANLELLIDHKPFDEVFARVSKKVPAEAGDIVQFTRWLLVQNKAPQAEQWLGSLPPKEQALPEVVSVRAEVVGELKDWDRLASMLEAGAWGPLPKDLVRLAMSTRLVSTRTNPALQKQIWDEALHSAGPSLPALRVLLRLAAMWQWEDEGERTLWTIARSYPDQTWAHQALFNIFRQRKNTEAMRTLMGTLRDTDASVTRYQSDWAILSLLLDQNSTWNQPKETLKSLYEREPQNAFFATGYALALAQIQKGPEALAIVEKMSDLDRSYAQRAPYLCYVYGVNRRKAEFDKYAEIVPKLDLLPEEKRLFALGREAVERPAPKPIPPKMTSPTVRPVVATPKP